MQQMLCDLRVKYVCLILALLLSACSEKPAGVSNTAARPAEIDGRAARLSAETQQLERFYQPMTVRKGDWLEDQREPGETFEQYVASGPTLPSPERRTIYIQPIGTFTPAQRQAIRQAADYLRAFYSLPVKLNADRPLGSIPRDKQRKIAYRNNLQIRTSYFLDDVLPKILPDDAAALLAFTDRDLYPEETWAFVFGQASFSRRVGVWSLYRLSDAGSTRPNPNDLLDRTLKIAVHETGHMFSMKHCIKYECLMSGTNHLAETDRRPLDNCPECTAKVAWAMNYDLIDRYRSLAAFWDKNRRPAEAERMRQKAAAIDRVRQPR